MPPHISIKNGRFALVDAGGNRFNANMVDQQLGFYIDVVVADANNNRSKIYFGREYVDGDDNPPLCWSECLRASINSRALAAVNRVNRSLSPRPSQR